MVRAGLHCAVGSMSDSRTRSPGFDTWSGHILWFLLPLIQVGQLSVTGESMCKLVLVNHLGGLSLPRKSVVRLTDSPNITVDIKQQYNKNSKSYSQGLARGNFFQGQGKVGEYLIGQ